MQRARSWLLPSANPGWRALARQERGWFPLLAIVLAAGCQGVQQAQSAVNSAGPQAALIERLWWPVVWLLSAIWVITMLALAIAASRRRKPVEVEDHGTRRRLGSLEPVEPQGDDPAEQRLNRSVAIATGATVVILLGLLVAYFTTGSALTHIFSHKAVVIDLTGQQWWWQADYRTHDPSLSVTTANEIHIPVGEPVLINLRSTDVIHSFWVPNLHGKKDLIPGHQTAIWIRADRPGAYRGECAEFCGLEHAKMALWVVAEPRAQYDRWYRAQLAAATPPTDSLRMLGERVFISRSCIMCHAVRGTPAGGKAGPDLTHLASRRTLGAGTLPNTTGNLGGWIVNPQSIKPGAKMPANPLSPDELQAVLAYLEGLK